MASKTMYSVDTSKSEFDIIKKINVKRLLGLRKQNIRTDNEKLLVLMAAIREMESLFLAENLSNRTNDTVSTSYFTELFEEIIGTKLKKLIEKKDYGAFVEALCRSGSSRIQAIKAVAEWKCVSETKIRTSNEFFREYCYPKKGMTDFNFLLQYRECLETVTSDCNVAKLPYCPTHTKQAFLKVLSDVEEHHKYEKEMHR